MVAVSLMPPVDCCASREGKQAESKAHDIASARETEAFESVRGGPDAKPSPGALPPITADDAKTNPVDTATRPLLSADLAVQALQAKVEINLTDHGSHPTQRLQAIQAYGAAARG